MAHLGGVTPNRNSTGVEPTLEQYRKQERALEETCKQFEGTMFSKIWKDMLKSARTIGGKEDKREYGVLEDTVLEMVSEHLSEQQGVGVWKVLYDQLHEQLPLPAEIKEERAAARAASLEEKKNKNIYPKA